MAELKAVLGTTEGLAEGLAEYYKQGEDGRFYLTVSGIDEMPAVTGLKKKNTELLGKQRELKDQLDALGVTPEELAELKERAESKGGKDAAKLREEYESKLKAQSEAAQREVAKAKEEADAAKVAAESYFVDREIATALAEHGGEPALVAHVMKGRVKVERDEDGFRAVVVGPDGQPRIKDSQNTPYGLGDLAAELKSDERFGRAFAPAGNSGSGAQNTRGGQGSSKTISRSDRSAWGENAEAIAKGEVTVTD